MNDYFKNFIASTYRNHINLLLFDPFEQRMLILTTLVITLFQFTRLNRVMSNQVWRPLLILPLNLIQTTKTEKYSTEMIRF